MARSSTTFPRKWNSTNTTVIRVPKEIASELLKIAKRLDASQKFRIREEPGVLILEYSTPRKVRYSATKPVNVASVPQRSPFRYPGGKTWLVPYIREWLQSKKQQPSRLIEPFAGGAIVSLTVAFERLAKHVIFAELDPNVAAVWRVVLNGHAEWLAKQILNFELTMDDVKRVLREPAQDVRDISFQTILRNRVQRGGIMAPGAGLIKEGENGRGLKSRWYPETLARRIREISRLKDRLTFVDPPYTLAARRLYTAWQIDHSKLFRLMSECKGDVLMSYDNTGEVVKLAEKFEFQHKAIAMKNTHHAKMTELLIGKNLDWLSTLR